MAYTVIMLTKRAFFFLSVFYLHDASCYEKVTEPIDIVYTWVDGNDPNWRAIKDAYAAAALKKERRIVAKNVLIDAATQNRFVDNDELKYSLRSVYRYAPWVNHIYIITMNQRPAWLADHPLITLVDHHEIFTDTDDLPTFNSHALESNLHRVPGLAEQFIYLNDDVFFGAPVQPTDFFVHDKLNVLFEKGLSPAGTPLEGETAYRAAWRNTNRFLDAQFNAEPRPRLCHAPFALRKSYMYEFEERFPAIFALNSAHRFRSADDFNVTNGLLQYYWLYQGKVFSAPLAGRPVSSMMVSFRVDNELDRTRAQLKKLKKNKPVTFCLQDLMDESSVGAKNLLHTFLHECYPDPAPWERSA